MTDGWTPRRQALTHEQVLGAIAAGRAAMEQLRGHDSAVKNKALRAAADALINRSPEVLAANAVDTRTAQAGGLAAGLLDRLRLTEGRLADLAEGLRRVADLPDPVGEVYLDAPRGAADLVSQSIRVPLGVVGVVYDAQPTLTVEAVGIGLKAGNAVLLRGDLAALHTDTALVDLLRDALLDAGLPVDLVHLLPITERSSTRYLVSARGLVDLVLVRGSTRLVRRVLPDASVPTVELGTGNCHIYVDVAADHALAEQVVLESKLRYPAMPHAVHTVLVHTALAPSLLPRLVSAFQRAGVTVHADDRVMALTQGALPARDEDWHTEYLAQDIAIGVVDSPEVAIEHIRRHGSGHTEVIVTSDERTARSFAAQVDAASVRINTPTGGTELGDEVNGMFSTQKPHARGQLTPAALTTTKSVTWLAAS